jgi:hypothetical protein
MKIHANTISKDDVTQEFHSRLMKFALFQFGIKPNLPKLLQNQMYMVLMVLHVLWKNEDVIDVIDHEIIQVLMKDIHYGKTMSVTTKKCHIKQDYN